MKQVFKDILSAVGCAASIVAIVMAVVICIELFIDQEEGKKAAKTGAMRSQHKCGVLFIQEFGKDGWETIYQFEDPYMEHECDEPNCDCHVANMIAYEQEENKETNS